MTEIERMILYKWSVKPTTLWVVGYKRPISYILLKSFVFGKIYDIIDT